MSIKEQVLHLIQQLPDEVSWDEICEQVAANLRPLPEVPGKPVSEAEADESWNEEIKRRLAGWRAGELKSRPVTELFPELNVRETA